MTLLPEDGYTVEPAPIAPSKDQEPALPHPDAALKLKSCSGPDADWIDRFMEKILQREYDAAREVLRGAIAKGVGKSVAEQYGKVLEDFLQQRDEVKNPKEVACFGVCALKEMTAMEGCEKRTGRGLIVPGYVNWGDELWRQRPVAYIQSPPSRKSVQVCCACLVPVGTLASQLTYLGLPVPDGAEAVDVVPGACPPVACPGVCGELFCSESCQEWARASSSHALLCKGCLSPEAAAAFESLDKLTDESEQEHLLLLAHHVAVSVLKRLSGQELPEVMQHCVDQFYSKTWDGLALDDAEDGDTPSCRRELVAQAQGYLKEIFSAHEELAAPFLTLDILNGMMGTYELVNMCISIPHPLNVHNERIAELMQGPALAKLHTLQKGVDEDSDEEEESEDEDEEEGDEGEKENKPEETATLDKEKETKPEEKAAETEAEAKETQAEAEAAALKANADNSVFAHVVGSALIEALSYMNHSCLPNARIDFASSNTKDTTGPGLWVFSNARRPLIPGDEVQMCYVPSVIGKPVEERQKRMKKFGFECRCRCCTTDEMLKAEGDIVIKRKCPL